MFVYNKKEEINLQNHINFDQVLEKEKMDETFERFEFNHPIYILYSSGTTGKPKCITHGAGNVLIEHNKEFMLHCDIRDNEKLFYYTTTGWMMWNWLVGGLATGSSIFLFDGAPVYPKIDVLLEYCQNKKINLFGVSAKYIDHLKNEKYNSKNLDLSSIKIITSTGSPLAEESFKYVYDNLKKDVHLASIAGGTDLVGCLVLGNLYSNVYMGEIQGQSLGIDVDVFTDEGKSVKDGEKGELVVKKPFPSMPVKFWGDDDGQKYHNAYFNRFENIWHHGDFIERTSNNGFIMRGRSDATLNPGGVRIGTSEIYQQVEDIDFITEGLVIGQDYNDDVRVILFVTTKNDEELNDEKIKLIKSRIRKNCSPKHVPSVVIKVPEIPRTKSGKIVELAVKKVIHGETINNKEANGDHNFIDEAREFRKKLGGGMRQVGIIASAARYAIENRDRLIEDHHKAEFVFNSIANEDRLFDEVTYKGTNMIFFKFDTEVKAETFRHNLEDKKIVAGFIKKEVIRLVFHKDIENEKLEEIVTAINYSSSPES